MSRSRVLDISQYGDYRPIAHLDPCGIHLQWRGPDDLSKWCAVDEQGRSQTLCRTNRRLLIIGAKKPEEDAPAEAFFSGILDEVGIYSRALSSAEIQEVMQASRE